MANHLSAEKALRQTKKHNLRNCARRSRIKTFVKKAAVIKKDTDYNVAFENFIKAQSELQRGVSKGVIHKNTAARKISRLHKKLKLLEQAK